ncbi:MAG: winged helix-turn-helix domain-containing tetratricopeptide repeat protein [Aestuariivirga sp.]
MRQERAVEGPAGSVSLSARSFDILVLLLSKPSQVVSKDEILSAVWPGVVVEENTLQVHISALRKALDQGMIVTVHGRGYKYAGPVPAEAASSEVPVSMGPDRKPVIAVLPFENMSLDLGEQYFSDGMTQDIIDRLTRFRMISVAGQRSMGAIRGMGDDIRSIAAQFAADYIVTGNIRRSETRIRIAARLTDCHTGNAVWAQHYDRPIQDLFAVQDEVASLIASMLMGRVEAEAATRHPVVSHSLTSYDLVLRGIWHFKKLTVADNERAAELFQAALDINPLNAEALRWLSSCCINRWFTTHDRSQLAMSVKLGRTAAELDPASALCHTAHAFPLIWSEGCEAAASVYRKALQANPDDPHVLAEMALVEFYRGNLPSGHKLLDEAERLNPMPPLWYAEFRAIAAFAEGRYSDALPSFAAVPECVFDNTYMLACMGYLGTADGFEKVIKRVRESGWNLRQVAADEPFKYPAVRERLHDGLTRAGITWG